MDKKGGIFQQESSPINPVGGETSCWWCYLVSYHNLQHCKEKTFHVTGNGEQHQPRLPEGTAPDHSMPGTLEGDLRSSVCLSAFKAANPALVTGSESLSCSKDSEEAPAWHLVKLGLLGVRGCPDEPPGDPFSINDSTIHCLLLHRTRLGSTSAQAANTKG